MRAVVRVASCPCGQLFVWLVVRVAVVRVSSCSCGQLYVWPVVRVGSCSFGTLGYSSSALRISKCVGSEYQQCKSIARPGH